MNLTHVIGTLGNTLMHTHQSIEYKRMNVIDRESDRSNEPSEAPPN